MLFKKTTTMKRLFKNKFSFYNQKHRLMFLIIILSSEILMSQTKIEGVNNNPQKKITHSFGFQFNNCLYGKGKFYDQTESELKLYPIYSYGSEFIFTYNFTHLSGFGFTLDLLSGDFAAGIKHSSYPYFGYQKMNDITVSWIIFPPDYSGFNLKLSYRTSINNNIFIKPELGVKTVWFPTSGGKYTYTFNDTLIVGLYTDNLSCKRKFFPDMTAAVNFLFHSKRNPRNNFVLGVNANIGFTPRCKGYYTIYPHTQVDGRVNYYSTYLGFHIGYEFISLPKTFDRKALKYEYFDFEKAIHTFGIFYNNGISLPSKLKDAKGIIRPFFQTRYIPEINIKYNYTFRKAWGFSIDIPFGLYSQVTLSDLTGIVPSDTVWANGTVGSNPDGVGINRIPYYGLSLKASYFHQIHRNIYMQPELGIKFVPFVFQPDQFAEEWGLYILDSTMTNNIPYMICSLKIDKRLYFVPDITSAMNFYIHGKNPAHNFIFGVNVNLCFVNRMAWSYHTTENLAGKYISSGKFNWKTSYIGFHIGYQFMYGKKKNLTSNAEK